MGLVTTSLGVSNGLVRSQYHGVAYGSDDEFLMMYEYHQT